MPQYRVHLLPPAIEAIRHLPPALKRDMKQACRILADDPHAGEPLQRELRGLWKYRIRRFRVVYRLVANERIIQILAIGPRANIYDVVRGFYRN